MSAVRGRDRASPRPDQPQEMRNQFWWEPAWGGTAQRLGVRDISDSKSEKIFQTFCPEVCREEANPAHRDIFILGQTLQALNEGREEKVDS